MIAAADIELGPAGLAIAFAAGFISFISPCVLPLVPGYLSFVSGVSFDELGARPRRVTAMTGAFVLGFTLMFVLLGAGVGWFGNAILENRRTLEIVAGAFVIAMGIVLAGLPLPRLLAAERRLHVRGGGGLVAAGVAGIAFAIGWSPCIGPTLGAILTLSLGSSGADATAPSCSPPTRSGSASRSCSSGWPSRRVSASYGWIRAGTGASCRSPPPSCS